MTPTTPVIEGGIEFDEKVYTGNGYLPLPVLRTESCVMSRWKLTAEEREYIASGGDLFVCQLHGGGGLQPLLPIAAPQDEAMRIMIEVGTPS